MVSILPQESPWDLIGKSIGQNLSSTLPGAVQQGYQRQQGLNAIDQLQNELSTANGDISKLLPALARAYSQNPSLERSGLGQQYLQQAKVGNAFGGQQNSQGMQQQQPQLQPNQLASMGAQVGAGGQPQSTQPSQGAFATPSPFNIMTPQDIDAESTRYALALGDPNAKAARQAQLVNQNNIATDQRQGLEDFALKSGITQAELPRFMLVGQKFDPRNPSKWAQDAKREYAKVKSNDEKLQRAFIPGLGNGLLGQNRDKELKKLTPVVQDQVKAGLEQETRNFLAENYLTPTEVEEQIHPLTPQKEKAISSIPKGLFPLPKRTTWSELGLKQPSPFISYEEAREKDPKALEIQQNKLADFFEKNVDNDTSLLVLRDKLVNDKDYDWRQIGPAIRQAESKGLKLNTAQSTEMADVEGQAPYQSLPEIFQSFDRVTKFLRGNK